MTVSITTLGGSRPFQCITSCDNKFGARDPKCWLFLTRYVYCNILDRLFDISTAMATTPFQRTGKTLPTLRKFCVQGKPSKIVKRKAVPKAYDFPIKSENF